VSEVLGHWCNGYRTSKKLEQSILPKDSKACKAADSGGAFGKSYWGAFGESFPKIFFVPPANFIVLRNINFKRMMKTKAFPPFNVFCPPNLKT